MTVLASKCDILGEHKQFFHPNLTASVSGKSHRVILVDTRVDICISARFNVKVNCPKPNPPIFTMCVSFFGTRNTRGFTIVPASFLTLHSTSLRLFLICASATRRHDLCNGVSTRETCGQLAFSRCSGRIGKQKQESMIYSGR